MYQYRLGLQYHGVFTGTSCLMTSEVW